MPRTPSSAELRKLSSTEPPSEEQLHKQLDALSISADPSGFVFRLAEVYGVDLVHNPDPIKAARIHILAVQAMLAEAMGLGMMTKLLERARENGRSFAKTVAEVAMDTDAIDRFNKQVKMATQNMQRIERGIARERRMEIEARYADAKFVKPSDKELMDDAVGDIFDED